MAQKLPDPPRGTRPPPPPNPPVIPSAEDQLRAACLRHCETHRSVHAIAIDNSLSPKARLQKIAEITVAFAPQPLMRRTQYG